MKNLYSISHFSVSEVARFIYKDLETQTTIRIEAGADLNNQESKLIPDVIGVIDDFNSEMIGNILEAHMMNTVRDMETTLDAWKDPSKKNNLIGYGGIFYKEERTLNGMVGLKQSWDLTKKNKEIELFEDFEAKDLELDLSLSGVFGQTSLKRDIDTITGENPYTEIKGITGNAFAVDLQFGSKFEVDKKLDLGVNPGLTAVFADIPEIMLGKPLKKEGQEPSVTYILAKPNEKRNMVAINMDFSLMPNSKNEKSTPWGVHLDNTFFTQSSVMMNTLWGHIGQLENLWRSGKGVVLVNVQRVSGHGDTPDLTYKVNIVAPTMAGMNLEAGIKGGNKEQTIVSGGVRFNVGPLVVVPSINYGLDKGTNPIYTLTIRTRL